MVFMPRSRYTPTPPRESGWFSVVGYAAADVDHAVDLQAVDLMAALRTGVWEWSDDPSATIELAMSGVPPVPAELYPSSVRLFVTAVVFVFRLGVFLGSFAVGYGSGGRRCLRTT